MNQKQSPFACNMGALQQHERSIHVALIKELFGSVQSISELSDGYAFRMPNDPSTLKNLVDFISKERLCCPFFGFAIVVNSEGAGLWLHITGREGVKPFIHAEFGHSLSQSLAIETGFLNE